MIGSNSGRYSSITRLAWATASDSRPVTTHDPDDACCPPISSTASPAYVSDRQQLPRELVRGGVVGADDVERPEAEHDRRQHRRWAQLLAQLVGAREAGAHVGVSVALQVHERRGGAHLKAQLEIERRWASGSLRTASSAAPSRATASSFMVRRP